MWCIRAISLSLLLASSNCVSAASTTDRLQREVPASYFGMHFHRADRGTAWPGREIGSWRLWDANVLWLDLEPKPNQWDFSRLNRYLSMAQLTGVELVMPLGMSPEWASARPAEKGVYKKNGDAAEPRDIQDWENYVRTVATRYKGRIRTYELWNEVNPGTGFFSGSPQALLALQRSAYRIIKEVDESAIFVAPSSVGESDAQLTWFERYLATGMANHADVISYHFYQPRKKPEAIIGLVDKVQAAMRRQGVEGKPLWNTESGYRMALGQTKLVAADASWPALPPDTAAAYVARALTLGWWAGLDRFYWYAWDNADLGFLDAAGTVTPAGRAYLTTARWLTGARLGPCTEKAAVWRCDVTRNGQASALMWYAEDKEIIWRFDGVANMSMQTLDGESVPLAADRMVRLTGSPLLIGPRQ